MDGGWRRVRGEAYVVVHVCGAHQVRADVVCPLQLICYCAIVFDLRTVVDYVVTREERCPDDPIVRLLRPVRVRLVASVSCQTSRELEETAIGDGVLVIIPIVEGEDLPPQSSSTVLCVPSRYLEIEYCLG